MVLNVILQLCIIIFLKEIQVHDPDTAFPPVRMQWRCPGDAMILLNKNINLHIISSLQALNN